MTILARVLLPFFSLCMAILEFNGLPVYRWQEPRYKERGC
jgi:hypothetical protein